MQDITVIFIGAFIALFLARKIAIKVGLVDKPNTRKNHDGHIPLVGEYLSIPRYGFFMLYILLPGYLNSLSIWFVPVYFSLSVFWTTSLTFLFSHA